MPDYKAVLPTAGQSLADATGSRRRAFMYKLHPAPIPKKQLHPKIHILSAETCEMLLQVGKQQIRPEYQGVRAYRPGIVGWPSSELGGEGAWTETDMRTAD